MHKSSAHVGGVRQLRHAVGDLNAQRLRWHWLGIFIKFGEALDEPPGDVETDEVSVDELAALVLHVLDNFQNHKAINVHGQRPLAGRIVGM
jgi:hypothetical protein